MGVYRKLENLQTLVTDLEIVAGKTALAMVCKAMGQDEYADEMETLCKLRDELYEMNATRFHHQCQIHDLEKKIAELDSLHKRKMELYHAMMEADKQIYEGLMGEVDWAIIAEQKAKYQDAKADIAELDVVICRNMENLGIDIHGEFFEPAPETDEVF